MFEAHLWGVSPNKKAAHIIPVGFLSIVALVHFQILSIIIVVYINCLYINSCDIGGWLSLSITRSQVKSVYEVKVFHSLVYANLVAIVHIVKLFSHS